MKHNETKILTDNQMTDLIYQHLKGDTIHKNVVKNDWLIFSYKTFKDDSHIAYFLEKINKWLQHRKLPITVLNFTKFDEEDDPDAVEWEVQITTHE